jgi:hypothetical protein
MGVGAWLELKERSLSWRSKQARLAEVQASLHIITMILPYVIQYQYS